MVGNDMAWRAGMTLWPVFNVSIGLPQSHPQLASFDTQERITDCRHLCFPGSMLEARTQVLYSLVVGEEGRARGGGGCVASSSRLFCG